MTRYIGLDAHAQSCTIAVMTESGRRLKELVVETASGPLSAALKAMPKPRYLLCEEGSMSEWLVETLSPIVERVEVIQATTAPGPKSDRRDAWDLANRARLGSRDARVVYKPNGQLTELRVAARAYRIATRDLVRAKNRFRGVLISRAVNVPNDAYEHEVREVLLKKLKGAHREFAKRLIEQLDAATVARESADTWLRDVAATYPAVRLIATVPGIGIIRAAQIVAIVVTPHRFRTTRQFWSYVGLAIVMRSSGDWKRGTRGQLEASDRGLTRGLNWNRNATLKAIFKGAATTVISSKELPVAQGYHRALEQGRRDYLAKLTLARRLASAVLMVWKTNKEYDPAKQQSHIA